MTGFDGERFMMGKVRLLAARKNLVYDNWVTKCDVTVHQTPHIFLTHPVVLQITDPMLPMILSGFTMNFILYEKDYGLAITRLCIVVSTFK